MHQLPIGIFDSGVGGLSVWNKIVQLMPQESITYYSDNKNCPYGNKPKDEVIRLSENIVNFLISKNCKVIVVACNTATAAAIDYLRGHYNIPFVGMEPAVKPAALKTKTNKVGILATEGTLKGSLFNSTKDKYAKDIDVIVQVGTGLVELVEKGEENSNEAKELLRKYIIPMMQDGIDYLVLGCTHYPFLIPVINEITNSSIEIIEPSEAVANRVRDILEQGNMLAFSTNKPEYTFYSSGDTSGMIKILSQISPTKYDIERL